MAVHDDISTLANVINIALDASKQNVVQKPNFYSAVSIHWKQHFVVHSVLELRLDSFESDVHLPPFFLFARMKPLFTSLLSSLSVSGRRFLSLNRV
jgi:hypothetical protein